MVQRLLDGDAHIRSVADELRATNQGLDTLLDDVATVEVPDHLDALIRGHGAKNVAVMVPNGVADGDVASPLAVESTDEPITARWRRPHRLGS